MKTALRLSFAPMVALLVGCSALDAGDESSSQSPEQVAQAFFDAGNAGDQAEVERLLTAKAREGLQSDQGFSMKESNYEDVQIGAAVIAGDTADVPASAIEDGARQDMTLKMRRDEGAWRVYAVAVSMEDGVEMTVDFEKIGSMLESMVEGMAESLGEGLEQAFSGTSPEQLAREQQIFEALEPVSVERYESAWQNTTDYRGQTVEAALDELATSMDLELAAAEYAEALEGRVKRDVRGLSKLEALERIAGDADLYPVYPDAEPQLDGLTGAVAEGLASGVDEIFSGENSALSIEGLPQAESTDTEKESELPPNALRLAEGSRPYPVAFAGPFIVEVAGVEEHVPHATGELNLAVRAYGLPSAMLPVLESISEGVSVSAVADAKGDSLNADEDVTWLGGGQFRDSRYVDTLDVDLKHLLSGVETIDIVRGSVRAQRVQDVQAVEFKSFTKGAGHALGPVQLTVAETGKHTRIDVTGPKDLLKQLDARVRPFDASGAPLGVVMQSMDAWGGEKAAISLNASAAPASLKVKLLTLSDVLAYPFELRDIPLKRFAEMPAELEALKFTGHTTPISAEFVEFTERGDDFSKALVRVQNHANKDATTVYAKFVYLDGDGTELDDFPHTLQGTYTSNGQKPVVAAGMTTDEDATAFFMPEETQSIRIAVEKVEFSDATVWEIAN